MKLNDEREEEEELEEEEEESGKNQPSALRVIKILIFYLALGFLGWNFFSFIFSSNFCNIEEVIIKGNDYLSEDEIFSKSQIKLGENIFKLDLKKSIDFLEQEPWIKEVEIKRIIPNKIIISLKERKSSAIVHIGEEYFSSTKEGMVLSKINRPEEKFGLPLVLGLEIDEIKIGEIIDKPEFRAALNRPEVIINKENLLREALEKIVREKLLVEYIDIRFKDSLVIKLKK
jgi:cell division septal protein FtsQ